SSRDAYTRLQGWRQPTSVTNLQGTGPSRTARYTTDLRLLTTAVLLGISWRNEAGIEQARSGECGDRGFALTQALEDPTHLIMCRRVGLKEARRAPKALERTGKIFTVELLDADGRPHA